MREDAVLLIDYDGKLLKKLTLPSPYSLKFARSDCVFMKGYLFYFKLTDFSYKTNFSSKSFAEKCELFLIDTKDFQVYF